MIWKEDIIYIAIVIVSIILIIINLCKMNYCKNCGHVWGITRTIRYTTKSGKWLTTDYDLCKECYKKNKL